MKLISFYSVMLFVAMFLCGSLTACSDDDEGEKENEVKTVGQFDFSFALGDDVLELADIEVIFIDVSGNKATEKVTTFPWKKTITFEKVPVSAGYKINITPKSGVELTKDKYQISESYKNIFSTLQEDKVVTLKTLVDYSSSMTVAKDKIDQYMSKFSSKNYAYKVDAGYSISETELTFE